MSFPLPTFPKVVHDTVTTAFKRVQQFTGAIEGRLRALEQRAIPVPLTLEQIRAALAPTGTHPLPSAITQGSNLNPAPPPVPAPTPPGPAPGGTIAGSLLNLVPQAGAGNIQINGEVFRVGGNGAIWPWRGAIDYALFYRFLLGDPSVGFVIANRVASGADILRVLGMWNNVPASSGLSNPFRVSDFPNYFTQLPVFADLLASQGLNLEFVAFADAQDLMPLQLDETDHFTNVKAAFAGKANVFIDLCNQRFKNGIDDPNALAFTRPDGILSTVGEPLTILWDYVGYDPPRTDDWPRKAKDLIDIRTFNPDAVQRPVISTESMGAGDVNIPGSRSNVANDFYWFAATAQMMGAGGNLMSQNGAESVVWDAIQQACATAYFQGLIDVPPDAQTWTYTRGGLADCPIQHDESWDLRTYAKFTDHQAVAVVIRPTPLWPGPLAVAPWVVDHTTGPIASGVGTLIFLTR